MKWQNAGSKPDHAKKYYNCIHPPVIFNKEKDRRFLDILPPPELHLLLGAVNTVYSHMLVDFKTEAEEWAKLCYVQREALYGGSSQFKGNSCRKLLKNVDKLRRISPVCSKYVKVFEDFNAVVKSCFGLELEENYCESIDQFKTSYLDLGKDVTPKIHAIFFHVRDFCMKHKKGLGFFSEQAMESVHFDFQTTWNDYKVCENNPEYANRLLRAVSAYNSHHL